MARKPVNSRQLEVLQWIADGCPVGVMPDSSHKTTAVALRNRGLAKLSKRGGWNAEITDEGRYFLEHGAYPGESPKTPAPRRSTGVPLGKSAPATALTPAPDSAIRPEAGSTEVVTASAPAATGSASPRIEVPVPAQLRNPHPVVAGLLHDRNRFTLSPLVRNRGLRILQALVSAAEREGYRVREVRHTGHPGAYMRWDSRDHLVIETGETSVEVRIWQETDRAPHIPTADELDRQKRWGAGVPKYDHTPNDRLRIEINSHWDGRRRSWRDGVRGQIEARLPDILEEVTYRHAEATQRRLKAEAAEIERESQRRIAVDRAKVLLRESHRAQVLATQAADWRQADDLRAYASAMEKVVEAVSNPGEKAAAAEWLEWARAHAEAVDPLNGALRMPDDPEATTEALRPFLRW